MTMLIAGCSEKKEQQESEPVIVETMIVGRSSADGGQTYSGTIEEESGTVLSFAGIGTVQSIDVSEGQLVKRGQLIGVRVPTALRVTLPGRNTVSTALRVAVVSPFTVSTALRVAVAGRLAVSTALAVCLAARVAIFRAQKAPPGTSAGLYSKKSKGLGFAAYSSPAPPPCSGTTGVASPSSSPLPCLRPCWYCCSVLFMSCWI